MTTLINLALSFFITFCSFISDLNGDTDLNHSVPLKKAPHLFVSNWEKVSKWGELRNEGITVFSMQYDLPKKQTLSLKKGEMIVFIKGYHQENIQTSKPLSLPFYLFSNDEAAKAPYYWHKSYSAGQI